MAREYTTTPCIYTDRSRWDAITSFVAWWKTRIDLPGVPREGGGGGVTINGVKKPNSHLAVIINENGESGVKIRNRDRCRIEAIPSRLAPC